MFNAVACDKSAACSHFNRCSLSTAMEVLALPLGSRVLLLFASDHSPSAELQHPGDRQGSKQYSSLFLQFMQACGVVSQLNMLEVWLQMWMRCTMRHILGPASEVEHGWPHMVLIMGFQCRVKT